MGLDIYAGTLTRYISGNWKTQLQQYAEANGHGYTKVTPDDEEEGNKNSPEEICKFVSKWRDQVVGVIEKDMQKPKSFFSLFKKKEKISLPVWEENNDKDYYTDKPDWSGYGALILVAAAKIYNEKIPETLPEDLSSHPLIKRIGRDSYYTSRWSLFHDVSTWLPYEREIIFEGKAPNDTNIAISTAGNLLNELNKINEMCWKADEETILNWRKTEGPGSKGVAINLADLKNLTVEKLSMLSKAKPNIESEAKLAFSIFYRAAKYSLENKVPILLDY